MNGILYAQCNPQIWLGGRRGGGVRIRGEDPSRGVSSRSQLPRNSAKRAKRLYNKYIRVFVRAGEILPARAVVHIYIYVYSVYLYLLFDVAVLQDQGFSYIREQQYSNNAASKYRDADGEQGYIITILLYYYVVLYAVSSERDPPNLVCENVAESS